MPTLNWIGNDKVVNHHLDVPFRTLEKQYTFVSEGQDNGGNMIIHGDNLDVLKALLPKFKGRVDCIYIEIIIPSLIQDRGMIKSMSLRCKGKAALPGCY